LDYALLVFCPFSESPEWVNSTALSGTWCLPLVFCLPPDSESPEGVIVFKFEETLVLLWLILRQQGVHFLLSHNCSLVLSGTVGTLTRVANPQSPTSPENRWTSSLGDQSQRADEFPTQVWSTADPGHTVWSFVPQRSELLNIPFI
jgi:hypothetical protein